MNLNPTGGIWGRNCSLGEAGLEFPEQLQLLPLFPVKYSQFPQYSTLFVWKGVKLKPGLALFLCLAQGKPHFLSLKTNSWALQGPVFWEKSLPIKANPAVIIQNYSSPGLVLPQLITTPSSCSIPTFLSIPTWEFWLFLALGKGRRGKYSSGGWKETQFHPAWAGSGKEN